MFKRIIALAGAGVAAGALALSAAGTAFALPPPPAINISVGAPGSISGQAGVQMASPLDVTYTFAPFLSDATFKSTATSLDGLTFTADDTLHSDSISGTPSAATNVPVTVTVTATKTYTLPTDGPLYQMDRTDCAYSLNGPTSFLVSSGTDGRGQADPDATISITGLSVDPQTGIFSFTVVFADPDDTPASVTVNGTADSTGDVLGGGLPNNSTLVGFFAKTHSVTKTCTDSVNVTLAVAKANPSNGGSTTGTTTTSGGGSNNAGGVPSGGVQTGGGVPQHHSNTWALWLILAAGAGTIPAGIALASRKRQGS